MPGLKSKNDQELDEMFALSEQRGSCLVASDTRLSRMLDARAASMGLICPLPRLYARRRHWNGLDAPERERHVLRGVAELHPNWIFSHTSAALLLGMDVPYDALDGRVHVATNAESHRSSKGKISWHHEPAIEAWTCLGIRVTSPLLTAFDCMKTQGFRNGLAIADSALKNYRMDRAELLEYVERRSFGRHGGKNACTTARHADGRSANGGESIARAIMWELGFQEPDLQVCFADKIEGANYYADYVWHCGEGTTIIGELDGVEKYTNPEMNGGGAVAALLQERRRESRLTLEGAPIMRFSFPEAMSVPFFNNLLEGFGVPRDHKRLIDDKGRSPNGFYGITKGRGWQ